MEEVSASLASGRGSSLLKREKLALSTLEKAFFLHLHKCSEGFKDALACTLMCSCLWECWRPDINHREAICSNQREDGL